jgi:hypothetical protein
MEIPAGQFDGMEGGHTAILKLLLFLNEVINDPERLLPSPRRSRVDDLAMHAVNVVCHLLLERGASSAIKQQAAGPGLPVREEDTYVLRHATVS